MALVGVSITKTTPFRDSVQEFNNVYHYQWTGLNPGAALAESLLDRLVTLEKNTYTPTVTFIHGRVWSAGGSPAANQMIFEKALTGVGANSVTESMDKERAYLIRWRAGIDSKGRPVYLRKWYHIYGRVGGIGALSQAVLNNEAGFTQAERDAIAAHFDPFHPISFNAGSTIGQLVGPTGREITGPREAHKYLEHRQLGDMWRA